MYNKPKLSSIEQALQGVLPTTKRSLGKSLVNALEPICQNVVGASLGEVLQATLKPMYKKEWHQMRKKKEIET